MQESLYSRHGVQESLYQVAGAGLSDSRCRSPYIRQRMHGSLYQNSGCGSLYITDSGCRSLYIRHWCRGLYIQRMQESLYNRHGVKESLYPAAGAGVSDSRCRSPFIRQRIDESLYQTADEEVSISNSGCRSLYIRQLMQKTLNNRQQMQ